MTEVTLRMRMFYLRRLKDVSGKSGTGRVAQVAEFDDGAAVLHWSSNTNCSRVASTEIFASIDDLLKVHGHEGRTTLESIEGESQVDTST